MKSRSLEISPQTLLLAIFEHGREVGRTTDRALCAMLGVGSARLEGPLKKLREAGHVQADAPRLTFLGLAAAAQLLSAAALEDEQSRRRVA